MPPKNKVVKQWIPNEPFPSMQGDFFYVPNGVEGWDSVEIQRIEGMLLALTRVRIISGSMLIGANIGIYIDARFPAQHS